MDEPEKVNLCSAAHIKEAAEAAEELLEWHKTKLAKYLQLMNVFGYLTDG